MKKQRFKFLVAVHAFFIQENEVLLLERANSGYMDGFYSVPAGHVDGGESIVEAMRREVREEVGIKLSDGLEPAHVMHRLISNDEERIDYFFVIESWTGNPKNNELHKCAGISWHHHHQLPENTVPYIKFAFANILEKKGFSEFDEIVTG